MLELTEEEKKNGWSSESLEKYILEREKAQTGVVFFNPDHRKPVRPKWANNQYSPVRWR